jgi:polysaccharide pyruvyl transferase WcaK-like protein
MKRTRIALFGIFGIENLGNECTLQAALHNFRERLPGAELYSISYEPRDTSRRHDVASVPVAGSSPGAPPPGEAQRKSRAASLLRKMFVKAPREVLGWLKAVRILRNTDMMVMTGTGMLTDFSGTPFGYPYDIFKWTIAARLAGCKVRFLSVGVGPIYAPLSKFFIKSALLAADYKSYRDEYSKSRLADLGLETARDRVFPDLAFSLPGRLFAAARRGERKKPVVGVGVINYYDWRAAPGRDRAAFYEDYLDKMAAFVCWLIGRGHPVRILHGDARHDGAVRKDLRAALQKRGVRYEESGIVDDDISSVESLVAQLACSDVVISPRFHNLLLALMLHKPVIAISYDPKSDALVDSVGLGRYRQPLDGLDVGALVEQFVEIESSRHALAASLPGKMEKYRLLLERQYDLVLEDL